MIPRSSDSFRRGGDVNGIARFHQKLVATTVVLKSQMQGDKGQILEYKNDRTEITKDLYVDGKLINTDEVSLGAIDKPVTIYGDVNVVGAITAGNLDPAGNVYPTSPSFHTVQVS